MSTNKTASQRVDGAERKIARSLGRDGFVPHPFPGDQAPPMTARYVLPWPPSANNSKMPVAMRSRKTGRHVARQVSTDDLRSYHAAAMLIARASLKPISGPVEVHIDLLEPSFHARDITNFEKAPMDALVKVGAIEDDCLVDRIIIERHRGQKIPGGRVVITIKPITPEGALL